MMNVKSDKSASHKMTCIQRQKNDGLKTTPIGLDLTQPLGQILDQPSKMGYYFNQVIKISPMLGQPSQCSWVNIVILTQLDGLFTPATSNHHHLNLIHLPLAFMFPLTLELLLPFMEFSLLSSFTFLVS